MKICTVDNCKLDHYSGGFCKKHYDKNRRHGDPLFERVITKGTKCTIDDCKNKITHNKMCGMHNARRIRHGDPLFINPKCNRDGHYYSRAKKNSAQWKKDNKKEYNAYLALRKKRVRQVTPKWADLNVLREFYKNCPKGYHVDHIIPITGKIVTGLNVIENLQYLPAIENLRKGNKY